MPFQKLQFKPGIVRDDTSSASEGGWFSCDKVRFRRGYPEKIGGWQRLSEQVIQGTCRTLSSWRTLFETTLIGLGTHLKFYVYELGVYTDVTPLRETATLTNAITTVAGSQVFTVSHSAHGAITGDFVTFSGITEDVGGISALYLNAEFQVTVIGDGAYTCACAQVAATSAVGGGTFTAAYQVTTGTILSEAGFGWGAGVWGNSRWGNSRGYKFLRLWSQVVYGQNLIIGPRGGGLYMVKPLDGGSGTTAFNRATALADEVGADSVPVGCLTLSFAPAARILVAYGANSFTGTDVDPLLVRWSDAENPFVWRPAITNQSGEYRLYGGTRIVAAAAAGRDTLILTDTNAFLMQYIGAPYVFGFSPIADNISVASPNAVTSANGIVYWMGMDKFYVYDGRIQTLPCPLISEVFTNFDTVQTDQVISGTNERFDEVWWFYCSVDAQQPDRYVIYNYLDKLWSYGTMTRTAWLDTPYFEGPIAFTAYGNAVVHELGQDDVATASTNPLNAYVESSDFDIGDGQNYAFVKRILPDVTFNGSNTDTPRVYVSIQGKQYPGGTLVSSPTQGVARLDASPVEQWTEAVSVRIRARQARYRIESNELGVQWRQGVPRIDVRADGRAA